MGFLDDALAGATAAGGMATGGMPMGITPEMMHERTHRAITADEARSMLVQQQGSDAAHQAAVASQTPPAPIAGEDPANPDGTTPQPVLPQVGSPSVGALPHDYSLRGFLEEQLTNSRKQGDAARAKLDGADISEGAGIDLEASGQLQEKAVAVAEAQREQPLLHQRSIEAAQFEQAQKLAMDAGQKKYDAQMVRVTSAVNEANQAEMHNFWSNASTGAKIMGVLAQALSGAANGLAGNPSAITPLDRLIEQDMHIQQQNILQKNKAAYREQGMLSTIQKATGDRLASLNAMKIAAWDRIEKQVDEMKGAAGGAIAAAQADQIKGLAKQRKATYTSKMQERLLNKAQADTATAVTGLNALDATEARLAKIRANAAQGQFSVIGLQPDAANPVNKTQYEKASNFASNYAAYIAANQLAKSIAAEGLSSNPIEQKARYEKAEASMQAAVRQMDATGAALSEPELKNVLTRIPSFWQVMGPKSLINGGAKTLDDATDAITDSYISRLRGFGLNHAIAVDDPIAGEALTRYVLRHADTAKVIPNGK